MSDGIAVVNVADEYAMRVFRDSLRDVIPYMEDSAVQEIMINRADQVFIERAGSIELLKGIRINAYDINGAIKALAQVNDKDVTPVLDCRMPGYRVAAVMSPVGINGPALCIRKHSREKRTLDTYLDAGGFDPIPPGNAHEPEPDVTGVRRGGVALRDFLTWMVRARKNVLIAGSTSSGKTTFLNALLAEVPHDQRVVTIEDTAELQVAVPNYVGLEASSYHGVTIRSLVRLALRFRPDRIIVGEVRGPETYDLLDAMNTGHNGGACSLHSDSPEKALSRIESLVRMNQDAANIPHQTLAKQIANTFDYVVFCSRAGNRRGPERVMAVRGAAENGYLTETLFDARQGA